MMESPVIVVSNENAVWRSKSLTKHLAPQMRYLQNNVLSLGRPHAKTTPLRILF